VRLRQPFKRVSGIKGEPNQPAIRVLSFKME